MDIQQKLDTIQQVLQDNGWETIMDRSTNCIAKKSFEILDGIDNDALVWFSDFAREGSLMITGQYWSEGNNVLGANGVIINEQDSDEKIKSMIDQFIKSSEFDIDESYGRRMRSHHA